MNGRGVTWLQELGVRTEMHYMRYFQYPNSKH